MSKPEALRLADDLESGNPSLTMEEAAAELRRLSAENDRLHQINQSHEMKLSVRGYEIRIADLETQRDALLEALRKITEQHGQWNNGIWASNIARAAIAAAEGE